MSKEKTEIRIDGLDVKYENDRQILKSITVEIPKNKITAIIGPSGSGKTIFLKCLDRMIDTVEGMKVEGNVHIGGIDVYKGKTDVTEIRKKVGLIPQMPNPLPMSIFDNIAYGPRIHCLKKGKGLELHVEKCLREAGLWEEVKGRLAETPAKLSVGQQQRLCLARALAVEPEVLLCDEPTASLDPQSSMKIEQTLLELKSKYTIVFVTHTLRQARRIADYAIFLYMGEMIEHGPSKELFSRPKNEKTKAYLEGAFG